MVPKKVEEESICAVCGDQAFGRHYGASACNGCKSFFRRSVWNKRNYKCRASGSCAIEKDRRNACRSCRFKKCLAAGLNPRAVQNERDGNAKRSDSVPKSECRSYCSSVGIQATTCTETDTDLPSCLNSRLDQSAINLVQLEQRVMTRVDQLPSDSPATPQSRLSIPFAAAFNSPSRVTHRTPLIITGARIAQLEDAVQDYRRAFVLFTDWLHGFHEFTLFNKEDQTRLVQHRFSPFYWSLCANWTVKSGCDGVCYANGSYFPRIVELQCINDVGNVCELMVRGLADPMRNMNMDETEFCLMRVVTMFKTDFGYLSAHGRKLADQIRDYYIRVLIRHISVSHSRMSEDAVACRVAEIMLLTSSLTRLNHLTNDNIRLAEVLNIVDWDQLICELSMIKPV